MMNGIDRLCRRIVGKGRRDACSYAQPLRHAQAVRILTSPCVHEPLDREIAEHVATAWQSLAIGLGSTAPGAWLVRPGFSLRDQAAWHGSMGFDDSAQIQWRIQPEYAPASLVFWSGHVLPDAFDRNAREQLECLWKLAELYELPEWHINGFGGSALISALVIAEDARSQTRLPRKFLWVRTNTRAHRDNEHQLRFCYGSYGLNLDPFCSRARDHRTSCFAIHVEHLRRIRDAGESFPKPFKEFWDKLETA